MSNEKNNSHGYMTVGEVAKKRALQFGLCNIMIKKDLFRLLQ